MSAEVDLFAGLAQILEDASIGVYNETGAYTTGQVGITTGVIPSTPEEIICLTPYAVRDDAALNESIIGVRVYLRGTQDPRSVMNRAGAIFNVFQVLTARDFGSMHLALMWRQSGSLDGQDDKLRWTRQENWYTRCNVPTLYRNE